MALEALAFSHGRETPDAATPYPFAYRAGTDGLMEIDPTPLWRAACADLDRGRSLPAIASAFHRGLAEAFAASAADFARAKGVGTIALGGGVFQNAVLLEETMVRLQERGLAVLAPAEVPANDGGLALGQAAIAAARLMAGD